MAKEDSKHREDWVFHELSACRAYRELDIDLCHWRLAGGKEVDFVLGDMRLAVEAKASARITPNHLPCRGGQRRLGFFLVLPTNFRQPIRTAISRPLPLQTPCCFSSTLPVKSAANARLGRLSRPWSRAASTVPTSAMRGLPIGFRLPGRRLLRVPGPAARWPRPAKGRSARCCWR